MAFDLDEFYYKTPGEMAEFLDSGQVEFITVLVGSTIREYMHIVTNLYFHYSDL